MKRAQKQVTARPPQQCVDDYKLVVYNDKLRTVRVQSLARAHAMIYSSDSLSSSRRSCATVASAERSSSATIARRSSAAAAPGLTVRAYSSEHTVR